VNPDLKRSARAVCDQIASRSRNRGFLIALEGRDGSGKITQRKLFSRIATQGVFDHFVSHFAGLEQRGKCLPLQL
jgi:hypothetical protein